MENPKSSFGFISMPLEGSGPVLFYKVTLTDDIRKVGVSVCVDVIYI